jgi:hypothetical protein
MSTRPESEWDRSTLLRGSQLPSGTALDARTRSCARALGD